MSDSDARPYDHYRCTECGAEWMQMRGTSADLSDCHECGAPIDDAELVAEDVDPWGEP